MTPKQKLEIRQSERRQRLNELAGVDKLEDAQRAELDSLTVDYADGERQYRAAVLAEDADTAAAKTAAANDPGADPEKRALLELRSQTSVGEFLMAALRGRDVSGPALELRQSLGLNAGEIPVDLFEPEKRAESAAPTSGTGVNVDLIRPKIYARSVAGRLGVEMPRVASGTYSTMTVTGGLSAEAKGPGAAVDATAAVLTPKTATPFRISARLSIRLEDVATIGVGNFESILRQNLTLAMSDQLDHYLLTGSGNDPIPEGLLTQLDNPTDPTAVVDWSAFVSALAAGVDGGPWAENMTDVRLLVNAETMRLAETTFRVPEGTVGQGYATPGEMSAAAYLRAHSGGFFASARMPDTASDIAQCLRYRNSTMGLEGVDAIRAAVCPTWAGMSVEDIYTDSAKAITHFTVHHLIGDVLIEQPSAYERVDLKVS